MKLKHLILFTALLAQSAHAADPSKVIDILTSYATNEGKDVDILKYYPVNKIDDRLPDIPFHTWLRSLVGDIPLEWEEYEHGCADDDGCESSTVTVKTVEGRCPEFSLDFFIALNPGLDEGPKVYSRHEDGLAALVKGLNLSDFKSKKATERVSKEAMVSYVMSMDVSRLDPSLRRVSQHPGLSQYISLGQYLTSAAPQNIWSASGYVQGTSENSLLPCEQRRLQVRVQPIAIADPGFRSPTYDLIVDIGSLTRGIEGEPKIVGMTFLDPKHWGEYRRGYNDSVTNEKSLSALGERIKEWAEFLKTRKPKEVAVKNMTMIGSFNDVRGTPSGHCSGFGLDLWQYNDRTFGLIHEHGGLCGDPPCAALNEVKFDKKTGGLVFSFSKDGYESNFAGNVEQDKVVGTFTTGYTNTGTKKKVTLPTEELKLKRNKHYPSDYEENFNVAAWCKSHKPIGRCSGVNEMCKSMGIE